MKETGRRGEALIKGSHHWQFGHNRSISWSSVIIFLNKLLVFLKYKLGLCTRDKAKLLNFEQVRVKTEQSVLYVAGILLQNILPFVAAFI